MKVEIEVRAFGQVEVHGTRDAFQSTEIARVYDLPQQTTLGELELLLAKIAAEIEHGYANPEQCLGKITIRAKMAGGTVAYLG